VSKAQVIAQALGGRVVRIVEVQEEGFQQRPPCRFINRSSHDGKEMRATPIEVGSLEYSSRVQVMRKWKRNL
jgi:uncharacterized protein YggE